MSEAAGRSWLAASAGVLVPLSTDAALGAALQHAGLRRAGSAPPATARLAVRYAASEDLRLAAELGYGLVERGGFLAAGVEASPGDPRLVARLGYQWRGRGEGVGGLAGLAAGGGVRLGSLGLDYAWQPFGDLGSAHRFSLGFRGD
ncbi:MAG: hypothetical protein AAB368_12105 [bacterium]